MLIEPHDWVRIPHSKIQNRNLPSLLVDFSDHHERKTVSKNTQLTFKICHVEASHHVLLHQKIQVIHSQMVNECPKRVSVQKRTNAFQGMVLNFTSLAASVDAIEPNLCALMACSTLLTSCETPMCD